MRMWTGRSVGQAGRRTGKRFRAVAGAAAIAAAAALPATAGLPAGERAHAERFIGSWTGTGIVRPTASSAPVAGTCRLSGALEDGAVTLAGSCQALIVVVRRVAATVTYDPRTGMYSGTYTGPTAGDARIAGWRYDDMWAFDITWAAPVEGDLEARLVIMTPGDGTMRIVSYDRPAGGGDEVVMLDVTLTRSPAPAVQAAR